MRYSHSITSHVSARDETTDFTKRIFAQAHTCSPIKLKIESLFDYDSPIFQVSAAPPSLHPKPKSEQSKESMLPTNQYSTVFPRKPLHCPAQSLQEFEKTASMFRPLNFESDPDSTSSGSLSGVKPASCTTLGGLQKPVPKRDGAHGVPGSSKRALLALQEAANQLDSKEQNGTRLACF